MHSSADALVLIKLVRYYKYCMSPVSVSYSLVSWPECTTDTLPRASFKALTTLKVQPFTFEWQAADKQWGTAVSAAAVKPFTHVHTRDVIWKERKLYRATEDKDPVAPDLQQLLTFSATERTLRLLSVHLARKKKVHRWPQTGQSHMSIVPVTLISPQ